MTEPKAGKGRPKGSEKDDSKVLAAVADLIATNPAFKPTTAMRRHNRNSTDAEIRRWQTKWKERGSTLLAEAQARSAARERQRATRAATASARTRLSAAAEAAMTAQSVYNSPEMRLMQEMYDSPAMRLMREIQNSPAMRVAREFQNSPAAQIMREQQQRMAEFKSLGLL